MSVPYGVGLSELELDEASRIACLQQLVAAGFAPRLRDVIEDRVVEASRVGDEVAIRWLSEEEAAPVVAAVAGKGNDLPSQLAAELAEWGNVLVPGYAGERAQIDSPGLPEGSEVAGIGPLREELEESLGSILSSLKEEEDEDKDKQ